jgi:hypothetical protein
LSALLKESRQLSAEDQHWPVIVDGRQFLLQPISDGVLMKAEQPRNFLYRIIPMDLHEPRIGVAIAHSSTLPLPG